MKNLIQKIVAPLFAIGLIAGGVQQANAATTTLTLPLQTVPSTALDFTSNALTFAKFDSSLGTLVGIQFTIGANVVSSISLTNQAGANKNFDIYGSAKIVLWDSTKTVALNVATPTVSQTVNLDNNVNQVYTETANGGATAVYDGSTGTRTSYSVTGDAVAGTLASSLILSDYVGSGTYSLYLSASDYSYAAGPSKTVVTSGSAGTTVSVSYTYVPATNVPEPSTWAMIVGGVGMLAFAQRMRRRSS